MTIASRIENRHNCNVAKTDVDLLVFLGTSLMDGYASNLTSLHLSSAFLSKYFPTGNQTYVKRYGTKCSYYNAQKGIWWYMNRSLNYMSANQFGLDAPMSYAMVNEMSWPKPIYLYHYENNGTPITASTGDPTWSANVVGGVFDKMIKDLQIAVKYLKQNGNNVRIIVNWAVTGLSSDVNEFRDEALAIMTRIRTDLDDNTIQFLWINPNSVDIYATAYTAGIKLACAIDNLAYYMDGDDFLDTADYIHPNNPSIMMEGFLMASFWKEKLGYANRPIVSNVTITGSKKINTAHTFSWDISGGVEDRTVASSDYYRLMGGTRVEVWAADDNTGTNSQYKDARNYGELFLPNALLNTKYIKIRVFGKIVSGAVYAYPVESAWFGPLSI